MSLAPIVVISVAGFSLASLYGSDPTGLTAYDLPIVDADRARVADTLERQRESLRADLERLAAAIRDARAELDAARRESGELSARTTRAFDAEAARLRKDVEAQIDAQLRTLSTRLESTFAARVEELRAPARDYL